MAEYLDLHSSEMQQQQADYYTGGILGATVEGAVASNNALYRAIKAGDFKQSFDNGNLKTTIGRDEQGRLTFQYEQSNVEAIRQRCKQTREMYQMYSKTASATDNPVFPDQMPCMELPICFMKEIELQYFGGRRWELIKMVREDKLKFYRIVNEKYPDFVIHPSGKIPLPDK